MPHYALLHEQATSSRNVVMEINHILFLSTFIFTNLLLLPQVLSLDNGNSLAPSFFTKEIYKQLEGLTITLTRDIKQDLGFCIKDVYVILLLYLHNLTNYFCQINLS